MARRGANQGLHPNRWIAVPILQLIFAVIAAGFGVYLIADVAVEPPAALCVLVATCVISGSVSIWFICAHSCAPQSLLLFVVLPFDVALVLLWMASMVVMALLAGNLATSAWCKVALCDDEVIYPIYLGCAATAAGCCGAELILFGVSSIVDSVAAYKRRSLRRKNQPFMAPNYMQPNMPMPMQMQMPQQQPFGHPVMTGAPIPTKPAQMGFQAPTVQTWATSPPAQTRAPYPSHELDHNATQPFLAEELSAQPRPQEVSGSSAPYPTYIEAPNHNIYQRAVEMPATQFVAPPAEGMKERKEEEPLAHSIRFSKQIRDHRIEPVAKGDISDRVQASPSGPSASPSPAPSVKIVEVDKAIGETDGLVSAPNSVIQADFDYVSALWGNEEMLILDNAAISELLYKVLQDDQTAGFRSRDVVTSEGDKQRPPYVQVNSVGDTFRPYRIARRQDGRLVLYGHAALYRAKRALDRAKDPSAIPSVTDLITELIDIGCVEGTLAPRGPEPCRRIRSIGTALNHAGGKNLMLQAHEAVRNKLGATCARELERVWNGVGSWLG